ncbi:PAAR domain-containing protein [Amorphus orientalis]|uniref:Zn-binding protein involved in type VI secretion n=1 Tax=Amorphus orientalis TaxID=649198 RepID=A0AAE4ATB9_9HYPH|nr:PAAR domain-containing protein [Amorphus orientalis]MDQ0314849.1 putative Zn-binding protein involved in type VI secretion [Amorphus orientalis]
MSAPAHRVGDPNDAAGVVTGSVQSKVRINGRLAAVNGSPVSAHTPFFPPHLAPVTANGSAKVRIAGIPANRQGDQDSCGHVRASGSPNVRIG